MDWRKTGILLVALLFASSVSGSVSWNKASDWDSGSSSGLVHESFGDNSAESVKLGWSHYGSQNSLTGYWPMDEDSGSTAVDVSGSGNDGSIGSVDLGKDGVFGTSSFEFKGDDIVVSSPNELPTGDSAFSTVFWFKNINANDNGGILHWGANSGSSASGQEVRDDGWQHYFYGNDNNCYNLGMWDGNWHMAVVTYDTSTNMRKMYLDGNLECSDDAGNVNIDSSTDIQIGGGDSSAALNGARLDEVRIWHRSVSQEEINQLYSSAFNGELNTSWKNFDRETRPDKLELKTNSTLNGQTINVVIDSDTDENGVTDESSEQITLNGSGGPYPVKGLSADSKSYRARITFDSSTASSSPELTGLKLESKGLEICDHRGPGNECVSNSSHDVNGKTFHLNSIFIAEPSAILTALSENSTIHVNNESRISGLWKGGFFIDSPGPRIVSGAAFRPHGKRIVIGN
ncbi:LamG domain-containing protein [Candidatus Nanosalina sp. VS9-1]|uniref:LamG domain-containing protein n=1 Tax=Candidatus Nanosalina sp. VS9-1 TaxID=3388566 RepID=UPI0039E1687D